MKVRDVGGWKTTRRIRPLKPQFTVCRAGTAFIVIVLLISSLLLFPHAAHAAQTGVIALRVEAGFDGYYRGDRWLPLLISVSNNGPDIVGELRVTADTTSGLSASSYQTSIELPTNSSKQIFLYITLNYGASQVKVELANQSGILADDTRPLKPVGAADLLYAVITESPRGTIDLNSVRSGMGEAYQANWRIDNVPRNADGLRALDVIVLADVDTGNLSNEQRQALQDWTLAGGHLVVTGGPNWQKTQAGLTELLPIRPSSSTTLTSLPSVASYAGHPNDTLNAPAGSPIVVAQGQLTPDAKLLIAESGIPILARRQLGNGVVDYLATDPGVEPYPSWKARGDFWFTLLTTTGQQPSWSGGISSPGDATLAANLIKGLRLPDVLQLGLFLGLYIIVIGPLNYLILKRLGRRELAWVTIPLIIFACSVVSYITGFSLRGTQATINRMAIVQVWPGSERAQVDGIIGVLAPRRAIYNLTVQNGLSVRTLDNSNNYSGVNAANYTIQEDQSYAVRDFPVDAGLTAAFATSGYTQATPLDGRATLTFTTPLSSAPSSSTPHVVGRVRNTTNMRLNNAVVLALGGSQSIGTLDPGEERSFDLLLNPKPQQSWPLSLGSAYTGGYYSPQYNASYSSTYNPGGTVQDIMGRNYTSLYGRYGLGYGDTPEQQELRRRQALLQAVVSTDEPGGGRGSGVYVAAWTDATPISVDLKNMAYTPEDTTLYMYRLPLDAAADSDTVVLPSAFLTWTITNESTRRDASPYGLSVQPGERVIFRYNPLPIIRFAEISQIKLFVKTGNFNQGVISLWDWKANAWVDTKASTQTTTIDDAQRFLGPENALQLKVEAASGIALATYDSIDVTVYGRLANNDSSSASSSGS
jgi:hypothetical protein